MHPQKFADFPVTCTQPKRLCAQPNGYRVRGNPMKPTEVGGAAGGRTAKVSRKVEQKR